MIAATLWLILDGMRPSIPKVSPPLPAISRSAFSDAATELVLFFGLLVVLDNISKYLLTASFQSIDRQLGFDWIVATILQSVGLAVLAIFFMAQNRGGPRSYLSFAIFIPFLIVGPFVFDRFQDFSSDGQWYHLDRVTLFPINLRVAGAESLISGGPAVIYPLLIDNLRGLSLSLLRTGPFSGVSVNFAMAASGMCFWYRHCHFLPKWARLIPPICSVASYQMLTYYTDGSIAILSSIVFLTSVLFALESASRLSSGVFNSAVCASVATGLLFAQLKFSFPYLVVAAAAPLAGAFFVLASGVFRKKDRPGAGGGAATPWLYAVAIILSSTLALGNPYFLLLKGLLGFSSYDQFSYPTIQRWANAAFGLQLDQIFGANTSPLTYFFRANILAIWPGGPNLIDQDIHAFPMLVARLVARIAVEDARFSGFGPLSFVVLICALWFAASGLLSAKRSRIAPILAVSFLLQFALAVIYPLGWWPRMSPAVYTTACVIVLSELSRGGSFLKPKIAASLCVALMAMSIAVPPLVLLVSVR